MISKFEIAIYDCFSRQYFTIIAIWMSYTIIAMLA